jgi:thiamine transport system ATP-binding protein
MLVVDGLVAEADGQRILDGVSLTVEAGSVTALLGPSGCGKTTLLRVIAGLHPATAGHVGLSGRDITRAPVHERRVGLMFQDYALFPHRDVLGNVEFGLRMQQQGRADRARRAAEVIDLVGLSGFEHRAVASLSGGESQRVALARALAPEPKLLMLDEPLGALDRTLRDRLLLDLQSLFVDLDTTVVYVTHDQAEALAVADRVELMDEGRIVQGGSPRQVWEGPADEFVARFLGFANVVEVTIADGVASTPWGLRVEGIDHADATVPALIRPHALVLCEGAGSSDGPPLLDAEVQAHAYRGDSTLVRLRVAPGVDLEAVVTGDAPPVGTHVGLAVAAGGLHVLDGGASSR